MILKKSSLNKKNQDRIIFDKFTQKMKEQNMKIDLREIQRSKKSQLRRMRLLKKWKEEENFKQKGKNKVLK